MYCVNPSQTDIIIGKSGKKGRDRQGRPSQTGRKRRGISEKADRHCDLVEDLREEGTEKDNLGKQGKAGTGDRLCVYGRNRDRDRDLCHLRQKNIIVPN